MQHIYIKETDIYILISLRHCDVWGGEEILSVLQTLSSYIWTLMYNAVTKQKDNQLIGISE